jgi:succinoglycan biosynthesis protein ExoA
MRAGGTGAREEARRPAHGGDGGDGGDVVSVMMVVRNERRAIDRALDAVLEQEIDGRLEVVVAEGRSDDGTRDVLARRAAADPRIVVVDNPTGRTTEGLNQALAAAHGPYVVRVDGHTILPPGYIGAMVGHLRAGRAEGAGGLQIGIGRGRFGRAVAALHGSRIGIGGGRHHHARDSEYVDHISQGAYLTARCRAVGGFDERWIRNQDCEFDLRYAAGGERLMLDPRFGFHWYVRESPRALARQYYQYGYWRCRTVLRHPGSLSPRWLVPPALVVALLCGVVALATPAGPWLLVAVLASYLAAVGVGVARIGGDAGMGLVPALAIAIPTVHLSWGTGFLVSLPGSVLARRRAPRLGVFDGAAPVESEAA